MKGERRVRLKAGQRDQHKTDANVKGRERAGKRTDGHGARPPATAREGRTRGASPTGAQRGGSRHQPQPRERPRMGSRSPREPDEAPRRPTVPPDPGDGRATPPGVFKPTRRNATIQVPGQGRGGQDTRDAGTGQNGAPPPPNHTDRTTHAPRKPERGRRRGGEGPDDAPRRHNVPPPWREKGEPVGKEGRPRVTGPLAGHPGGKGRERTANRLPARRAAPTGGPTRVQRTGPDQHTSPSDRESQPTERPGTARRTQHAREPGTRLPAREKKRRVRPDGSRSPLMILPQVHLRKPCYDFYFL